MNQPPIATLLDLTGLKLDELAASCAVTREWVIEHVRAGVLLETADAEPQKWLFTSREVLRARKLRELETTFDANPELAGLVVDLIEEITRLRGRVGVRDRRR